ncbi:hypothetical protein [Paenibacillus algorifonticola]|uniref:hypothetical protein n=1 Tax=Paenibacillus algorifonticola TaxID=684063 RepID=UPI0012E1DF4B|nr:hypothetical protein [Paenibacillus algorifonticola]
MRDRIQRIRSVRQLLVRDLASGLPLAAQLETGSCSINDVVRYIGNMHLPFAAQSLSW